MGISHNGVSEMICHYKIGAIHIYTVTYHLNVHVGKLERVCHQPNLSNQLHHPYMRKGGVKGPFSLSKSSSNLQSYNATRECQIDRLRMTLSSDEVFFHCSIRRRVIFKFYRLHYTHAKHPYGKTIHCKENFS